MGDEVADRKNTANMWPNPLAAPRRQVLGTRQTDNVSTEPEALNAEYQYVWSRRRISAVDGKSPRSTASRNSGIRSQQVYAGIQIDPSCFCDVTFFLEAG